MYFDARGFVPKSMIGKTFGAPKDVDMRPITRADMERVRPIDERQVRRGVQLAQLIWPDVATWKDSLAADVRAFLTELTALSEKHGLWLRAPYATTWPILSAVELDGKERIGYEAMPHSSGLSFTINRIIKSA